LAKVLRIVLQKTRIGRNYRTTVPEKVREELKLDMGDEILWIKEGDRIVIESARREIER